MVMANPVAILNPMNQANTEADIFKADMDANMGDIDPNHHIMAKCPAGNMATQQGHFRQEDSMVQDGRLLLEVRKWER